MRIVLVALFVCLVLLAGCLQTTDEADPTPSPQQPAADDTALRIVSSAFEPEGEIPTRHTCDDDTETSPPLTFQNVTPQAESLALIMEDPDAPSGTVIHWTFWNVPANQTDLPEDVDIPALDGREGQEYRGPCPPDGEHRYFFYAYAVNGTLDLESGASADELRAALDGRTVDQAEMYGTYCRPQAPTVGCLARLA